MTSRLRIDAMMSGMRTAHGSDSGSDMESAADPTPKKNSESARASRHHKRRFAAHIDNVDFFPPHFGSRRTTSPKITKTW